MELFGGAFSLTGVGFFIFCLLVIAATGFLLGRVTVKGVNLGTAGVFVAAIVFGVFFYGHLDASVAQNAKSYLKIIETLGLTLFVTSVGFIAGPKFFHNLRKNYKSYVLLGGLIILIGGLSAVACIFIGRATGETNHAEFTAMVAGLLSGSLTSTPAFSAAKDTVEALNPAHVDAVTVGYGIAYLFGVVGVVLFVQLIPILERANVKEEVAKISAVSQAASAPRKKATIHIDAFGIMPFALAAAIGTLVGKITVGSFSLTTTGGCLILSLLFGHFARIGKVSLMPPAETLKVFREFGLMLFLIGAGVSGGAEFVARFKPIYFLYGVLMTLLPMIVGYLFAKYVLKLSLFNNLGSITGGMTSTPALGTLIHVTGTEDVASAYAATYPIALVCVVIVTQLLLQFF